MKLRMNYVSNSSSCNFLIYGKNLMQTLVKSLISEETLCAFDYWGTSYHFTIKELNKEIINQCNNNNIDDVKNFIHSKIAESIDYFKEKVFHENIAVNIKSSYYISELSNHKIYDSEYDKDIFALNDELKQEITNKMLEFYEINKSDCIYDYYLLNSNKMNELIENLVNDIYNKLKENNNELYVVSFGDNHGICSGSMGYFVESEYLGNKEINLYLDEKINIINLNEH